MRIAASVVTIAEVFSVVVWGHNCSLGSRRVAGERRRARRLDPAGVCAGSSIGRAQVALHHRCYRGVYAHSVRHAAEVCGFESRPAHVGNA